MASFHSKILYAIALLIAFCSLQQLVIFRSYEKAFAERESIFSNSITNFELDSNKNRINKNNKNNSNSNRNIKIEWAEEDKDTKDSAKDSTGKFTDKVDTTRRRIAILAGPHKTGSTSTQTFFSQNAGWHVFLLPSTKREEKKRPHPRMQGTNWVFPIGVEEEYHAKNSSVAPGFQNIGRRKFYAPLMVFLTENEAFFDDWNSTLKDPSRLIRYFQAIFRDPWDEGKNIVFGSEELDGILNTLHEESAGKVGEEMHVAPKASDRIDWLLNLLPWDDDDHVSSKLAKNTTTSSVRVPPLRLQDIEVIINYRTPRLGHIESFWHQIGEGRSLRELILTPIQPKVMSFEGYIYTTNSLALALQFVRKGIKTTLVHMNGVKEKEAATKKNKKKETFGGLAAAVVCDVLKMGNGNSKRSDAKDLGPCDNQGKLYVPTKTKNVREDTASKGLDEEQLAAINSAYEDYDCGLWFYLQKYQAKGLLQIVHPSKDLFATCKSVDMKFSFSDFIEKVVSIARQEPNISISISPPNNNTS